MTLEKVLARLEALKPGFRAEVRGCSADEVATLEALLGHGLPLVYRDFLLAMGNNCGGVDRYYAGGWVDHGVDFSYRNTLAIERSAKIRWPARLILVGKSSNDPYESVCIDRTESLDGERVLRHCEGREHESVRQLLRGEGYYELAQSFGEMLFVAGFVSFLFPRFEFVVAGRHSQRQDDGLRDAEQKLQHMGYVLHPGSSGWTKCFTRDDSVAIAFQSSQKNLCIHACAHDARAAQRLGALLQQKIGVSRARVTAERDHEY